MLRPVTPAASELSVKMQRRIMSNNGGAPGEGGTMKWTGPGRIRTYDQPVMSRPLCH